MSSDPNTVANHSRADVANSDTQIVFYEVLEALGKRAFVPFLAIPALLGLTPLGGSTVFMAITGALLAWAGVQLLLGRDFPHLPGGVTYSRISKPLAQSFMTLLLNLNEWLDEVPNRRMSWVTTSAFAALPNLCLVLVGLALPILALTGQPVFLLCIAVLIYSVSLLTRDGRYVPAAAIVLSIASVGPILQFTP